MADRTYIARSKRDPTTNTLLITETRLITGAGDVFFENGEAEITEEQARALSNNPQLTISVTVPPTFDEPAAPPPAPAADAPPPAPVDEPAPAPDPPDPRELTPEQQSALDAAREHLEAEGEEVPPPAPPPPPAAADDAPPAPPIPTPDGFDRTLPGGEARCLAAKADGSQCTNPEKEPGSGACHIGKHQEQVAART